MCSVQLGRAVSVLSKIVHRPINLTDILNVINVGECGRF